MLVYRCRACGAAIVFVKTPAGKKMPCDVARVPYTVDPAGKDTIITPSGETLRGAVLPATRPVKDFAGLGYRPHWADCPAASKFKKGAKP
jgi:hypothetical protein